MSDEKKPDEKEVESVAQASDQQANNSSTEEKVEDPNWRAFREARKRDRLEKEAAERRAKEKEEEAAALRAAMEAAFHTRSTHPSYQNVDKYTNWGGAHEEVEETEDQRIERMVTQAIEKRQKAYDQEMAIREKERMPKALRESHPDFDDVVTTETLDYLEYHYPEIAKPLGRLQDSLEKWSDIYRAIKRFVPNASNSKQESLRSQINQNKPKSISSTQVTGTESNLSSPNFLTKEKREQNWRRMQRELKGL